VALKGEFPASKFFRKELSIERRREMPWMKMNLRSEGREAAGGKNPRGQQLEKIQKGIQALTKELSSIHLL